MLCYKYWSNKIYHDKNLSHSAQIPTHLSLHLDEVPKNVVKRHALHDNLTSSDYKSNVCQPPELPPPVICMLSNHTKTYQTFYTHVHITNIQHYYKWSPTHSLQCDKWSLTHSLQCDKWSPTHSLQCDKWSPTQSAVWQMVTNPVCSVTNGQ